MCCLRRSGESTSFNVGAIRAKSTSKVCVRPNAVATCSGAEDIYRSLPRAAVNSILADRGVFNHERLFPMDRANGLDGPLVQQGVRA